MISVKSACVSQRRSSTIARYAHGSPRRRARADGEKAEKQLAEIARRSNASPSENSATKRLIFLSAD